jgi:hypothetical protein
MLEEAGVVSRVIDGRNHRLALRPDTLADTSEWIDRQRTRWEALFDALGESQGADGLEVPLGLVPAQRVQV